MKVARAVAAPAEAVWTIITDLDRTSGVVSAITAFERLDDGTDFAVGTRWNETRVMFGRSSTEKMEVTALDPGRSYTVESWAAGAHYTSVMTIEPTDDGCSLSMSFEGKATSTVSKVASVFAKLLEGSTRTALLEDLDEIADEAERAAANDVASTEDG